MTDWSASIAAWKEPGVAGLPLSEARLQVHWAGQIVGEAGRGWLEHRGDDSHSNLGWKPALGALVGHQTREGMALGIAIADFALIVAEDGRGAARFPLRDQTWATAAAWAATELEARTGRSPSQPLASPAYEMPPHAVALDGPFDAAPDALVSLAGWFENAIAMLAPIAAGPSQTPLRCWPHHFDIATLRLVDPPDGETARSIGAGFSPGDASIAEPYFYVSPWPYPEAKRLGELDGGGTWNTEGYTAANLRASDIRGGGEQVAAYLESALTSSLAALDA